MGVVIRDSVQNMPCVPCALDTLECIKSQLKGIWDAPRLPKGIKRKLNPSKSGYAFIVVHGDLGFGSDESSLSHLSQALQEIQISLDYHLVTRICITILQQYKSNKSFTQHVNSSVRMTHALICIDCSDWGSIENLDPWLTLEFKCPNLSI